MKHKIIKKKLLSYLDDALSESEFQAVNAHLEHCPSCREDLEALTRLWHSEKPVIRLAAPPDLWRRITGRLEFEERNGFLHEISQFILPVLRPAIIIAGLVLIVIGGIELGHQLKLPAGNRAELPAGDTTENFGLSYFEVLPPGSIDARVFVLSESEM